MAQVAVTTILLQQQCLLSFVLLHFYIVCLGTTGLVIVQGSCNVFTSVAFHCFLYLCIVSYFLAIFVQSVLVNFLSKSQTGMGMAGSSPGVTRPSGALNRGGSTAPRIGLVT